MKKVKHELPKEVLIYVFDEDEDGKPMFAVATNIEEIPEDINGARIGIYTFKTDRMFVVQRDLKGG